MKLLAPLLFALVLLTAACGNSASSSDSGGTLYLSLGDSVAAGAGASEPAETSFPAVLAEQRDVDLVNLAVGGATTRDIIDRQVPQAITQLEGDDLAFITVSAGGNDLAALIPNATCQQDPLPETCPLDESLARIEDNLVTIMDKLRGAFPDTPVVLLAYPNFFSGTGHPFEGPAGRVLPELSELIGSVASQYEQTAVADAAPAFEGSGDELTGVNDPHFDPHPNDAGHRAIAEAFQEALERLQ